MTAPLRIQGLDVSYAGGGGATHVLSGVDLEIAAGEVVGLVGEGGSGKSTLVNAVCGLLPEQAVVEGTVEVFGATIAELPFDEQQRRRGTDLGTIVAGARARLNPMARIGDQISNVVRDHGASKAAAKARALELIGAVGIPDPARRARAYPHELSGGMAQRVVIAMALANDPRFIVADEPTSGLDVTIQAEILELLDALIADSGATLLLVTRDFGIVAERCRRVTVLAGGRIVEDATVERFFAGPASAYGRGLLGAARDAMSHGPAEVATP